MRAISDLRLLLLDAVALHRAPVSHVAQREGARRRGQPTIRGTLITDRRRTMIRCRLGPVREKVLGSKRPGPSQSKHAAVALSEQRLVRKPEKEPVID